MKLAIGLLVIVSVVGAAIYVEVEQREPAREMADAVAPTATPEPTATPDTSVRDAMAKLRATPTPEVRTSTATPRPTIFRNTETTIKVRKTTTCEELAEWVYLYCVDYRLAREEGIYEKRLHWSLITDLEKESIELFAILEKPSTPQSAREKQWPRMCRNIEQWYLNRIGQVFSSTSENWWWTVIQGQDGWETLDPIWQQLPYTRSFVVEKCAEHVLPYGPPPILDDEITCEDYEYRDDAISDFRTYWHGHNWEKLQGLRSASQYGGAAVCAWLPERKDE